MSEENKENNISEFICSDCGTHVTEFDKVCPKCGADLSEEIDAPKQRHGCLTAWLILMIAANTLSTLIYLSGAISIKRTIPTVPEGVISILIIVSIFDIICAIALLNWKKWGFWGFLCSSIFTLIINLSIGVGIVLSFFGLVGFILLYALLRMGKDKNAWVQLE